MANHAVKQLQAKLERLAQELDENAVNKPGRMFGVLVVKTALGRIGYLSAFSGQSNTELGGFFVPEIIDPAIQTSLQQAIEPQLNDLTQRIESIKSSGRIEVLEQELDQIKRESDKAIAALKRLYTQRRRERKAKRLLISQHASAADYQQCLSTLSQQSISDKRALTKAKNEWKQQIQFLQNALTDKKDHLVALQQQYHQLVDRFQQQLFEQCPLRNAKGETKSVNDLFQMLGQTVPEGAGEGTFIKLLQYAYLNDYKPLTMAQFWWGKSPKAESRQHGEFYGACRCKCKPLLSHMVKGLRLEPNLLHKKACTEESIQIIHQDESLVVINKPLGLLSVPGSDIEDCVQYRMQMLFPKATGPMIVYRLDMSTSGLMVIALNLDSYQSLQRQFIERTIKKRYVALLEGQLRQQQGEIALPLRVDLDDRPRQLVL